MIFYVGMTKVGGYTCPSCPHLNFPLRSRRLQLLKRSLENFLKIGSFAEKCAVEKLKKKFFERRRFACAFSFTKLLSPALVLVALNSRSSETLFGGSRSTV